MASESEPLILQSRSSETRSRVLHKVDLHVLSWAVCPILLCCVDRGNLGFVANDLCEALQLEHKQYGMGAGMFFGIGYIPVQFFGNRLLKRFGAPAWLAFIMFAWGCVSCATSLIQTPAQFYATRFLLGLAEGGTFPGVFYYLANFYPADHQTGPYSVVMAATSLAMLLASPLVAGLMTLDGLFGVEGWRYVFIGSGLLTMTCSLAICLMLPDSPAKAAFLEPNERQWLLHERASQESGHQRSYIQQVECAVKNKTWWLVCLGGFILLGVYTTLCFWIVLIIHEGLYGEDDSDEKTCGSTNGNPIAAILLTAIPYVISSVLCIGLHAFDSRVGIRNRPLFSCCISCFSGLSLVSWVGTRKISFVTGFLSLIFGIATHTLSGGCNIGLIMSQFDSETGATCIGIGNILYSFGPLVFPPVVGAMVDAHGYALPMLFLGGATVISGILAAFANDPLAKQCALAESRNEDRRG